MSLPECPDPLDSNHIRGTQSWRVSGQEGSLNRNSPLMSQAIIEAFNDSQYTHICENVKGILFMGTPYRGSDFAIILSNILGAIFVKKVCVDQLKPNCETVTDINRLFGARTKTMDLVSFFESTGTGRLGITWVPSY